MDASGQTKSIRVAVRVRPLLPSDAATDHSLLQLDPGRPNEVLLASGSDRRTARRYTFDQVFGPEVSQDELYDRVGVSDLVSAAVDGYHATIFAYGQTGSGKTFTMEGYRYVSHGSAATATAAGSAGGRGGAARAGGGGGGAPQADFAATPEGQLGLTPRAVRELFATIAGDRDRRYQIRCSFVQIYREQVYDLLNPATLGLGGLPGGAPRRVGGGSAAGSSGSSGGPLRMRWSQQEGFYLENLFTPEVESAEEAIGAFQSGVANKVMSSHRLNAASSRSHCLFTLHVSSHPVASPLESRAAKLSLVDLAGSERAALTGATEGALRDESVAINKSLFTLRQVITALTDAAAAAAAASPSPASQPPAVHVPYRDSKLTCLLKHSLGGSALTLMVACLSPADRFLEENASTLDYAARARRITNQIAVNEDPRSRLIRELRTEVAFLRQQLEAAGANPPPLPPSLAAPFGGGGGGAGAAKPSAPKKAAAASPPPATAESAAAAAAAAATGAGAFDGEDEESFASRLRSSDVEALVRAVIDASRVAVASSAALSSLRSAYARTAASLDALRAEYDTLAADDARLRDRLSMLESLVVASSSDGASRPAGWLPAAAAAGGGGEAAAGAGGGVLYTASTAALIELEELRRENALLHERLRLLEPETGPSGVVVLSSAGPTRGSVASGQRPGTGAAAWGGGGGAPPRGRPATSGSSSSGVGVAARGVGMGGPRRQQQPLAQRAQSAGPLLPTGTGRLIAGGAAAAVSAAAAAAANPFVPSDVLMAVLPPPPPTAGGGGGGRPATVPRAQASGAGSSSSGNGGGGGGSKTLTVDQLRNVLKMTGAAIAAATGPVSPSRDGSGAVDADNGAAAAAGGSGGGGRPPMSGANSSNSSNSTGRLSELGHAVASRALASGVRLSTTGKLLPAAPARMAVEAGAAGAGSGIGSPLPPSTSGGVASAASAVTSPSRELPALSGAGAATAAAVPAPMTVGTAMTVAVPAEAALVQLLAERNALTRQRLAGSQ